MSQAEVGIPEQVIAQQRCDEAHTSCLQGCNLPNLLAPEQPLALPCPALLQVHAATRILGEDKIISGTCIHHPSHCRKLQVHAPGCRDLYCPQKPGRKQLCQPQS